MTAPVETYVYGIARADSPPAVDAGGVGPLQAPVRVLTGGSLAALVSDVPPGPLRAERDDLRRHMDVLQRAVATATVVPLRFGTIMPGDEAVREELLEARRPALERLLDELDGHVEVTLKGTYAEAVLADIVRERPAIAELRERVAQVSEAASYYDRIRLGELVSQAIAVRRDRDTAAILERLEPLAADVRQGALTHERGALSLAFLVARDRLGEFDDAAAAVAHDYDGTIAFRYTGPHAPFSFVRFDEEPAWG
jgi:hypothetical protein